jgi:hypothetical protein
MVIISRRMGKACNTHRKCEMHTEFCSENLKKRYHPGDLGIDGSYKKRAYRNVM